MYVLRLPLAMGGRGSGGGTACVGDHDSKTVAFGYSPAPDVHASRAHVLHARTPCAHSRAVAVCVATPACVHVYIQVAIPWPARHVPACATSRTQLQTPPHLCPSAPLPAAPRTSTVGPPPTGPQQYLHPRHYRFAAAVACVHRLGTRRPSTIAPPVAALGHQPLHRLHQHQHRPLTHHRHSHLHCHL